MMNFNYGNPLPEVTPQLPALVQGQQIRNGPFLITVTNSMVAHREKENRELQRRWEEEQRRRRMSEGEPYFGDFNQSKVRRRFIRRVFTILTLQLLFTAGLTAFFMFYEPAKIAMLSYKYTWIVAMIVFLVTYMSISCCTYARRSSPCNVISLILLTVSLAFLTAAVSIFYSIETVLMTAVATASVAMIISAVSTCSKFDLTKRTGFLLIVSLVGSIGMLALFLAMYFTQLQVLHIAVAAIGTLLISMYLFFDLQTIMGGRTIELSPDEVIYATTQLYVDIVMLYRYLLILMGLTE